MYCLYPNLDWLTLAQHHGLPTRLLDWSWNALAALWFTVNESIREKACKCDPELEKYGVVWIFMTTDDDWMTPDEERAAEIFSLGKLRVCMPKYVTSRVTTQLGFFTIHPYENGDFRPLDETEGYERKLKKILIPRGAFSTFRRSLDRMGINRFSIFPDLDGLARYVRWYHFSEDDEAGGGQIQP